MEEVTAATETDPQVLARGDSGWGARVGAEVLSVGTRNSDTTSEGGSEVTVDTGIEVVGNTGGTEV